jgi:hypothetical protein
MLIKASFTDNNAQFLYHRKMTPSIQKMPDFTMKMRFFAAHDPNQQAVPQFADKMAFPVPVFSRIEIRAMRRTWFNKIFF